MAQNKLWKYTGSTPLLWWQTAVFYEIWVRSFADSNGDGIGDLPGITSRLDYLRDLGVDALWLGPHYPSPLFDTGYDVAGYTEVAPEYGTLDDFKILLEECHRRGMRLILDLVLNHTSDQHPWFSESRYTRTNPKRDWYVWRDGKAGGPPNNWGSFFGGPAWELDPVTGQYYYHMFFKQQPDLNWRNPAVKQAMFDAARFWLDMGVDGFRLDAVGNIYEDPRLADHDSDITQAEIFKAVYGRKTPEEAPVLRAKFARMIAHQTEQPGIHELMRELRALVDGYPELLLVGETDHISYYGNGSDEFHLLFNFALMNTDRLTPAWVLANQRVRLPSLPPGAWPSNTLNNHDVSRTWSKYGDGQYDAELARLSAALLFTLPGTPFLYYGEEIGMTDLLLSDIRQYRDNVGMITYQLAISEQGMSPEEALCYANTITRDKCRTPMQWSSGPNAGFSPPGVETWLPVHPNHAAGVNAAAQEKDPASLLNLHRRLARVRRSSPALLAGSYTPLDAGSVDVLAFLRIASGSAQTVLVALNMGEAPARVAATDDSLRGKAAHLLLSTHPRPPVEPLLDGLALEPFEIYIAEVSRI